MALMEDERLILRWLSQYGPLRWPQIRGLLYYRPQRSVNRLVQNMKHARRIAAIEDGEYLAVDQYCEPKQRMITAVWVLLQFIEQIAPEAHWQADAPAQISFLKDKTAFLAFLFIPVYQANPLCRPFPRRTVSCTRESDSGRVQQHRPDRRRTGRLRFLPFPERHPLPGYSGHARRSEPWSASEPVSQQPLVRNHRQLRHPAYARLYG